jgi:group I intron endonuclease
MVIYKTTNLINGKYYIGKDEKNDPKYLGSGTILNRAIKKYGRDNFKKEILEKCETRNELNEREKYWIKELSGTSVGYNIALGGNGGDTYSMNPNLDSIREKFKGENNHFYGKTHTDETKHKIKHSKIGKPSWNSGKNDIYSDETLKKMSEARSGLTGENSSRYIHIDKNELSKILKNNTIKETADHFNVSVSCIRKKISEYNFIITKKSGNFEKPLSKKIISKIIELRKSGKTIIEIADTVCIGRNKIKKVLIENGISTKRIK